MRANPHFQRINRIFFVPLRPVSGEKFEKSRLLSLLLLAFIPGLLLGSTWTWFGSQYEQHVRNSLIVFLGIYALSRLGYFTPAAWLTIAFHLLSPFLMIYSWDAFTPETINSALPWLMLGIVTGFLIFDLLCTALTIAAHLLAVVVFALLEPRAGLDLVLYPLLYLIAISAMLFVAALVRHFSQSMMKHQEQERRHSEERFQALFEAAFEGIVITSEDKILDANPAYEALTGYSLEELRAMDPRTLFAEENRDLANTATKSWEPYEALGVTKSGKRIWVEVRGKPAMYHGKPVRAAVVSDITERKAAQQRQVEVGVEREKVQLLRRVIGNLSHDLRTPLSVIKTSTYLLGKVTDQERRTRHLETLEYETNRLQHMIEDLLSLSRLDRADLSEYQFVLCDVNALSQDCLSDLASDAARRGHTLEAVYGPELPAILMDPVEFRRMLKHVIANAINFMHEPGTITLVTARRAEYIVVAVEDTGPGIAEKDLPHIFDRFYRGDSARGGSGGTGLGLTIARRIAEAHGGSIEVESVQDEGATFRILLPVISPHENGRDKVSTNG
jgi:PAS domain S-box-containing protein